MEPESLEGFFTNEEYEEKSFTFGDVTLTIKCLAAASTDYDLTGQVLWPAATLLAEHLACTPDCMTTRKAACELGSGLGLAGLLCGQFCNTVLSDHNAVVLNVLQENAQINTRQHQVRCQLADWESNEDIETLRSLSPRAEGFDLMLGADICYSIKALPFIFRALGRLLARRKDSLGLLGYVSRAAAIDRGIYAEAKRADLLLQEVSGTRKDVGGGLLGTILSFKHV